MIGPIVRGHHERWDGSGYPDRLRGEAIPVGARVVSVVDAYDAMTHARPYRNALSLEQARAELVRSRGTQFDPELVDLLIGQLDASGDPLASASSTTPELRVISAEARPWT
jgi:HD-GYP domain-containing protein (c-di-GMP phosphodiesterase class II)